MKYLYVFLLVAFLGGNVTSLVGGSGIRVTLLDVATIVFVSLFFISSSQRQEAIRAYFRIFGVFITIAHVSLLLQYNRFSLLELLVASLYLWRFIVYSLVLVVIAFSTIQNWALWGLWLSGIGVGILGLIQYYLYPNLRNLVYLGWDPHQFRVFSTLLDPNFTGIVLVLTLLLGAYLSQHKNTPWRKFVIGASGLVLITLLLTYSRGSYLAFFTMLGTWALLHKKVPIIIGTILIFLGLLTLLPRPGGEGVNLLREISIKARLENSQEALRIFRRTPIFGVGFNTLRFVRSEPQIMTGRTDISHSGAGFHNGWLFLLVTTGILGLLSYLWIWWKLLGKNISAGRSNPLREVVFLSFVAVLVHSLFDNSLFYPWSMLWLWVLSGVAKGLPKEN